jgi:hypothetical protein
VIDSSRDPEAVPTDDGSLALSPPLSSRLIDAVCIGFAGWTLCAHAVVLAGGSLPALVGLALVLGVAALAVDFRSRRREATTAVGETPESPVPAEGPWPVRLRWVGLAVGLLATAVLAHTRDPIAVWGTWLAILGAAAVVFLVLDPPRSERPVRGRALELGLFGLALLCAVYALVVHRPDADDAFYVNLAVAAVDRHDLPLLAVDTLHGRDDLPIHFAAYRLHSFELLNGAIAWLSGIPVLYVFHWLAAAGGALLLPLAHARLFRLLTPRSWLLSTAALVVVLVVAGETHRWYGNFALVRMWQGKAFFLFVFLPLVYAYAIRFALRPTRRGWLLLAAAQIAAVGCSSSAVWAAPAASASALCCVLRPSRRDLRRLLVGLLASAYVLAAGLAVRGAMTASSPTLRRRHLPGEQLGAALVEVLGDGTLWAVGIGAVLVAWACRGPGLGRRFAIAVPLAATIVLLSPWADAFVRANFTGPSFWRALWSLPIPILVTLVVTAPIQWQDSVLHRGLGAVASVALVAGFALAVPRYPGWSAKNEAWISRPTLKVDPSAWPWAMKLNELAPGQRVVAPPGIATWIPTVRHHAYPLMVRNYLRPNRERIGENAYLQRYIMTEYARGELRHEKAPEIFEQGLALWNVKAVLIAVTAQAERAREILRRQGFERRVQGTRAEIWVRRARPDAESSPSGR